MLKYYNYDIVFQEIPDEVTLAVNITNCPYLCEGCHSPHLRKDTGLELNESTIENLLQKYGNQVTCICFMGGDRNPDDVERLSKFVKSKSKLKTAWYSGNNSLPASVKMFDYVKVGAYKAEKGGLRAKTTNQRLYHIQKDDIVDITNKFHRK